MKKLASIALIALLTVTGPVLASTEHNLKDNAQDSKIFITTTNNRNCDDRNQQDNLTYNRDQPRKNDTK